MRAPGLHERASGILLHPTCLPGPHGCGDLGEGARRFADFLKASGQRWWQMLPVAPTGYGNSPYSAQSSFGGNPLFISLSDLETDGWLPKGHLRGRTLPAERVDYGAVGPFREGVLRAAFERFLARRSHGDFDAFRERSRTWLPDFALFRAIKRAHGEAAWITWEKDLRSRKPAALQRARKELATEIRYHEFEQYLFGLQWDRLKTHCHERGVGLIGDVPIFVAHDSADVWAHSGIFRLASDGRPKAVAGVPPDYFSKTGQRWGNPLYDWKKLDQTGYRWWIDRLAVTLERFDVVRLDHFIGFCRYWEVPGDAPTAEKGRWLKGPGESFFFAVKKALGDLPLIAEDLGAVTDAVRALRDQFDLPGIRVLQFAFGTDPSAGDFLPHNYPRRCVAYTGTHDNDTTVGWFQEQGGNQSTRNAKQAEKERAIAKRYLASDGREIHWDMIRMVEMSVANTVIIPLQDVFGLGSESRMNRPGVGNGNWEWRFRREALTKELANRLAELAHTYGRTAQ